MNDEDTIKCVTEHLSINTDGDNKIRVEVSDDTSEDPQWFVSLSAQAAYLAGVRLIEKAMEARGRDWKVAGMVFDTGESHVDAAPTPELLS